MGKTVFYGILYNINNINNNLNSEEPLWELLEAKDPNSPIAKFIEKRGEGMHHIAFYVDDIEKEMK